MNTPAASGPATTRVSPTDAPTTSNQPSGDEAARARGFSRRRFFGAAGAAIGVAGAGGVAAGLAVAGRDDPAPAGGSAPVEAHPFYGAHQSGILTPAQDRLHFAAFDVTTTSRDELIGLLRAWTAAAAELTQGLPVSGGASAPYDAPPFDTGEATGLPASRLTITIGFGPGLFRDAEGRDRFGLVARQPAVLTRLPHFPADNLDPRRSDGDLCVQACADDPQVAVHAVRNLSRIAFGAASIRWAQLGYGRTSSTSTSQDTPRNLFGFKDGTANIKAEEPAAADEHVWVDAADDPRAAWLAGGSYLVARRINMHIETWDRTSLREQEAITGRDRRDGAPLSGGGEFTEPDFSTIGGDGQPLIGEQSHLRLAHHSSNNGHRLLRRGYNFTDGSNALGRLDAGLFFIAFARNPTMQYVPLQNRLSKNDQMMEYLQHTGSALFAVPRGAQPGGYVGQDLFTA
jgi:deferrochelatase/peroxidase EfeB